jgi:hypothetical protein
MRESLAAESVLATVQNKRAADDTKARLGLIRFSG